MSRTARLAAIALIAVGFLGAFLAETIPGEFRKYVAQQARA